jgi:DNA helicase II / ATP-dependent DNA helicase PcrA
MKKKPDKARLAIAGPGAGKTHAMVDEIVRVLPSLQPHQKLAAITFTNAAADTIRDRLQRRARLRSNVFIGTTHTFVNRFILSPCATLFGKLPEDRIVAAINVHAKGTGAAAYTNNLIRKGVVPFDAMLPLARELLCDKHVRTRLGQRIAYLFVDEFQDTDIVMLEIIEQLRKSATMVLYAVGDPEQFVMSFTYRGKRTPAFDKLPIFRFQQQANANRILDNHRSNGEIVAFANRFRSDLQQRPVKPYRNEPRVLFIRDVDLKAIVAVFQSRSEKVEVYGPTRVRLYLAEENATYAPVMQEYGINPTSNLGRTTPTLLGDALELVATALDRSPRKACADLNLSRLQWRAAGTTVLRQAMRDDFRLEGFITFIASTFQHEVSDSRYQLIDDGLAQLKTHLTVGQGDSHPELCASIRRAKGLEADAVLAVAKGLTELKKWLATDRAVRSSDKQDKCRIGYVAFTRPREMLCIACLKLIDAEAESMLAGLGVHSVSSGDS